MAKSILERFDEYVGTRISPLFDSFIDGDIKRFGQQIVSNVKYSSEKFNQQSPTDQALSFSPGGIGKVTNVAKTALTNTKPGVLKTITNFFRPTETRIAEQGVAGKQLKNIITRAADIGEVNAGKRIETLTSLKLNKLARNERFNLLDVLEGKAKPISQRVQQAFTVIRQQTDELAEEATRVGVRVKQKTTLKPNGKIPSGVTSLQRQRLLEGKEVKAQIRRPFEKRENFFPHVIPNADTLAKGSIRQDVAENIVRRGIRPNVKEAEKFIDDYRTFLDSGQKQDSLTRYMVETGQAANEAEAFANLQRFRNRTIKRQGSLEYAREADLPFFDPDPTRVIPSFVTNQSKRLAQIEQFGQDNQQINELIKGIKDTNNNADFARQAVDRILEIANNSQSEGAKVSTVLRSIQGFKLGLASIPNMSQGVLNSLLAADMRAVAAGLKGVVTRSGNRFALRSGATLESVLQETTRETGALSKFLKATGFTATEKANRVIAANAGRSYGNRLFQKVLKNPDNKRAVQELKSFGLNVEEAVKRGKLTDDEVLMIAKKFTDLTQFRSRPQDLPFFASSNSGKVFFQFKNFIYGQTRLLYRETVGELKNKNFGRATRNTLILGTVFPLAGEAVADIRSLITGRKRESKGLERYFENIAQTGAMGILLDTVQAGKFGKGTEALAGPTLSDAGELINIAGGANKGRNLTKFVTRRIPLVGQVTSSRIFPSQTKAKKPQSKTNRFNTK